MLDEAVDGWIVFDELDCRGNPIQEVWGRAVNLGRCCVLQGACPLRSVCKHSALI